MDRQVATYLADLSRSYEDRAPRRFNSLVARERLFFGQLQQRLESVVQSTFRPVRSTGRRRARQGRRLCNLELSDLHYGSDLQPEWVGHRYTRVEEARRTASVCVRVADYKTQYRDETDLMVHILGDTLQGQLHDPRDGQTLTEQVGDTVHLLGSAIRFLAGEFPTVSVACEVGNHGRNKARHHDRAVHQKQDAIETMVYLALQAGARALPNVRIQIPKTPYYTWEAFGKVGFGTHGDTVMRPGYPGKSINVQRLHDQANRINIGRVMVGEKPVSLFIFGHVHIASQVQLPSGPIIMTNGPLVPPDHYAVSEGVLEQVCAQWMWESVPDHIVGDSRLLQVDRKVDQDSSLDSVISSFDW